MTKRKSYGVSYPHRKKRIIEIDQELDGFTASLELALANEARDVDKVCDAIEDFYLNDKKIDSQILQKVLDNDWSDIPDGEKIIECILLNFVNIEALKFNEEKHSNLLEIAREADKLCRGEDIKQLALNNKTTNIFLERARLNMLENERNCTFANLDKYKSVLPKEIYEDIEDSVYRILCDDLDDLKINYQEESTDSDCDEKVVTNLTPDILKLSGNGFNIEEFENVQYNF